MVFWMCILLFNVSSCFYLSVEVGCFYKFTSNTNLNLVFFCQCSYICRCVDKSEHDKPIFNPLFLLFFVKYSWIDYFLLSLSVSWFESSRFCHFVHRLFSCSVHIALLLFMELVNLLYLKVSIVKFYHSLIPKMYRHNWNHSKLTKLHFWV